MTNQEIEKHRRDIKERMDEIDRAYKGYLAALEPLDVLKEITTQHPLYRDMDRPDADDLRDRVHAYAAAGLVAIFWHANRKGSGAPRQRQHDDALDHFHKYHGLNVDSINRRLEEIAKLVMLQAKKPKSKTTELGS